MVRAGHDERVKHSSHGRVRFGFARLGRAWGWHAREQYRVRDDLG
jgi:hypothetical protein